MSNLIISNTCNAHCGFCFASEWLKTIPHASFISMDQFCRYLDYLVRTGFPELRLLGGEPTLHPQFADFVRMGRENGLKIVVFSNGLMPDSALTALSELAVENCLVVVNMNAATTPDQLRWRGQVLEKLADRSCVGFTIQSVDFSLNPMIDLIERYGMRKLIRLGIALPTLGKNTNQCLSPADYQTVGSQILEQSRETAAHQIDIEPDCGFVTCMFSEGSEELFAARRFHFASNCAPIPDMCSDGILLPCFALASLIQTPFDSENDLHQTRALLDNSLSGWRTERLFAQCQSCAFADTARCCGGCLAARLIGRGGELTA